MPTIKDVARECGVSANTVSSVINNKQGEVSEKTRARILEAVQRLGYRPNAAARRMLGKQTNTIGIADMYLASEGPDSYKGQILERLVNMARRSHYDLLYYSGHLGESGYPSFLDGRCDGLICFTGSIPQQELAVIFETRLPMVFIGTPAIDQLESRSAVVDVDNETGGYIAAKHLLELGHRRIRMIEAIGVSGNPDRVAGYKRALEEFGIPADETVIHSDAASRLAGYQHGCALFSLPQNERPTALFCFNDGVAIGILRAANENGVRIPEDISLVGFDDVLDASLTTPPLTTVRQPLGWIGEKSVETLLRIIRDELPRDHQEIAEPTLVIRGSTAPPPNI